MTLYHLCCSVFYNDNDAIVVLPEIQPFLSSAIYCMSVTQGTTNNS